MFKFPKHSASGYFNLALFACFLFISALSLNIKFIVAQKLLSDFDLLTLLDIVRSEISFSLALLLWFYLSITLISNKWISVLNSIFFLLISFFILKLLGIYAITHDATPYAMIEYGSYLLNISFINPESAFLFYIALPALIFVIHYIYYLSLYLTPYLTRDLTKAVQQQSEKKIRSLLFIVLLLVLAFIPPLQNKFPLSLAYHPYVFTVQNAFTQKLWPLSEKNSSSAVSGENYALDEKLEKLQPNKNIVLIILESISSTAIDGSVSPNMNTLKRESWNIEQAFAVIPHTSKALVAIHCGFSPFLDPYLFESTLGIPHDCLPTLLEKKGYHSVYFQSPTQYFENREALIKNIGFDEFIALEDMDRKSFEKVNYFSYEDNIMLPKSHEWLSKHLENTNSPFIATYLTGTSHHNYETPEKFDSKQYSENEKYNRYLNAVNYVDTFVGNLIQQYKDLGIYENTLFIIVSDHGEGFSGHKPLLHNNNIYNSGLKIPMIIHQANLQARSIKTPLSQRSIQSIALYLASETGLPDINALEEGIHSSCWYKNYCYSLITKNGKHTFKLLLEPIDKQKALYEINSDPDETINLIDQYPELAVRLEEELISKINQDYAYYQNWYKQQDKNYRDAARKTFSPFKSPE